MIERPLILVEIVCGFLQSIQTNVVILYKTRPWPFRRCSQFVSHLNTKYITSSQNKQNFIVLCCTVCNTSTCFGPFDVEYIYAFVRWGGLQTKSITSQRAANKMAGMRYYDNVMTTTRWRLYVTMETLWQQQDSGYAYHVIKSTSSTVQS